MSPFPVLQVHVPLSMKTVRLAYVNLIPWVTFKDGIYGGIDYEIWNVMAQKLNVSATFSEHKTYSSILKMVHFSFLTINLLCEDVINYKEETFIFRLLTVRQMWRSAKVM